MNLAFGVKFVNGAAHDGGAVCGPNQYLKPIPGSDSFAETLGNAQIDGPPLVHPARRVRPRLFFT